MNIPGARQESKSFNNEMESGAKFVTRLRSSAEVYWILPIVYRWLTLSPDRKQPKQSKLLRNHNNHRGPDHPGAVADATTPLEIQQPAQGRR